MPTLPALGLLALYPLHRLMKGRNFTAALVASPLVAAALVAYFYLLLPLAEDNLRLTRQSWNTKPSWAALERRETPDYERQAAALRRLTRPDETVYVWGWCPGTYRSVYRRCPSRFATLEKCGQLGSLARFIGEGAVADIRRAPPAVFALYVGDWERMSNEPDNDFARWLGAHYEITETTAGMHLLRSRAGK